MALRVPSAAPGRARGSEVQPLPAPLLRAFLPGRRHCSPSSSVPAFRVHRRGAEVLEPTGRVMSSRSPRPRAPAAPRRAHTAGSRHVQCSQDALPTFGNQHGWGVCISQQPSGWLTHSPELGSRSGTPGPDVNVTRWVPGGRTGRAACRWTPRRPVHVP